MRFEILSLLVTSLGSQIPMVVEKLVGFQISSNKVAEIDIRYCGSYKSQIGFQTLLQGASIIFLVFQ